MSEQEEHAERLAAGLGVAWSDVTVDDALRRLHERRRQRRATTRGVLVAAAVVVVAVGALALHRSAPGGAVASAPSAPPLPAPRLEAPVAAAVLVVASATHIDLGDGSAVEMLAPETRLETSEVSASAVTIRLRSGSARFSVVHRPARVFRVVSGDVSIIDVGTEFTVARHEDSSTVEVSDGVVRVEWQGGVAEVHAGERRVFPPPAAAKRPVAHASTAPAAAEGIEDLLGHADEARLRGDAAGAIAPLRRAIETYREDPRAALAAFMLGRVYLDELHDPAQAAAAFAQVRTLAADGPLAEDALACEVEAWGRAGDRQLARERAEEYLRLFPDGHRVSEVRRSAARP